MEFSFLNQFVISSESLKNKMSREIFEQRITELQSTKGKNNVMLTRHEYKEVLKSMKKMHSEKEYIPTEQENNWKKRFQIMSFNNKDGRKIEYLVKPDKKKPDKKLRQGLLYRWTEHTADFLNHKLV